MSATKHREWVFDCREVPSVMCHAATLAETSPGEYCAAWFAGSGEGSEDTTIWVARRRRGQWSPPERLARPRDTAHWNPVLFHDPGRGETHLFFKVGPKIASWETWTVVSRDGGRNWSAPRELVPGDRGGRGPVKNKPLRLSNGDWLAPASLEGDRWRAFVDRSRDGGRTWEAGLFVSMDPARLTGGGVTAASQEVGVIQPALWESEPGHVHMLLRSTFGWICRSDSEDHGRTWREVYATDLANNNSGIDVARLPDGSLALVCNPVSENWGPRTPLTLFSSSDNGLSWFRVEDLEDEPAREGDRPRPEFSYPTVLSGSEGPAWVYTWKRKCIVFGMLDPGHLSTAIGSAKVEGDCGT